MRCPACGLHTPVVLDSRVTVDGAVRRRRLCECGVRFSTLEVVVASSVEGSPKSRLGTALSGAVRERLFRQLAKDMHASVDAVLDAVFNGQSETSE